MSDILQRKGRHKNHLNLTLDSSVFHTIYMDNYIDSNFLTEKLKRPNNLIFQLSCLGFFQYQNQMLLMTFYRGARYLKTSLVK